MNHLLESKAAKDDFGTSEQEGQNSPIPPFASLDYFCGHIFVYDWVNSINVMTNATQHHAGPLTFLLSFD
jgi:hypothetical protein